MASTLSSVLSRLDGRWELPRWLPACLPACWLGWLAGCFDSRLLEKPDSSCAKLCFPSCVYVPTHAWMEQCWLFRCTCVYVASARLFVALDFDPRSAQILALARFARLNRLNTQRLFTYSFNWARNRDSELATTRANGIWTEEKQLDGTRRVAMSSAVAGGSVFEG